MHAPAHIRSAPRAIAPMHARPCTAEQLLALAVLQQAWADWTAGRGGQTARAELHDLLVVEGGGIWTDWLGVDRDVVREAALRQAPAMWTGDPRFEIPYVCAACGETATVFRAAKSAKVPKYCESCRARIWPGSVRADAQQLARFTTTKWPDMHARDRARWWE